MRRELNVMDDPELNAKSERKETSVKDTIRITDKMSGLNTIRQKY